MPRPYPLAAPRLALPTHSVTPVPPISSPGGRPMSEHDPRAVFASRNARYGLVLFFAYLLLYAGFMYLAAFRPDVMASTPFGGTNLAILYGIGLILAAIVLSLVYMVLCRT